jgi:serine protease Do
VNRKTRSRFVSGGLLVLALLLLVPAGVSAQSLSRNQFRGGALVLAAFEPVVETAAKSTVLVKSDGKTAALGLIVDSEGFIVTKASRLDDGVVTVHTHDDLDFDAEIVGIHHPTDLAMLKIDGRNLVPVEWAEKAPAVGRWVVTPGLSKSPVAIGVVSVRDRSIEKERGVLGIQIEEDTPGPRITQVFPDSGADAAGLKEGDRISQVDKVKTPSRQKLVQTLGEHGPGESVELVVHRKPEGADEDEEFKVLVTLGFPFTNLLNRGEMQNQMGGDLSQRRAGFDVVLQHDTYLKPEDCGGPLLDLSGHVVGINIARAGRTESYAIPAAAVRKVLADLRSGSLAPPKPEEVETKQDDTTAPKKAA